MKKTLRNFLEVILDTNDPDRELEALFFACSWLHGFDPKREKAGPWMNDAAAWVRRYGQPTEAKLLAWVDGLGVEADIPGVQAVRNLKELLQQPPAL